MAWFLRHSVRSAGGLPALAYVATAFAVAAPVISWMMRSLPPPAGEATSAANAQAMYAREISSIAVMEGAALFCAIAVLVGPYDWPVIPAAILLALILSRAVGAWD